ncbi:MAG: hypothetical protein HRT38_20660 [Alteromonadaceae bacterium]|nr:hypothetical protein [Alteromonadaceae bacterium]
MAEILKGNVIEGEVDGAKVFYYTFMPNDLVNQYGLPSPLIVGVIDNPYDVNRTVNDVINDSFKPNSEFKKMLHSFCTDQLPKQTTLQDEAKEQEEGWIYIIDQRTLDPLGNVPPDDIVGALEVKGGVILGYQENGNYKIHSKKGFINFGKSINQEFENYMLNILMKK